MKNNFYKTKIAPPYYQKPYAMGLSTTFNLRNVGGVYIIFKKNTMVYCGYSKTNLYKTLYRHFQEWKTSSQVRTIYKNLNDITVRVIYCKDGNQASRLEKAIIIKYKPRDNTNKYNQYTMDFKEKEIFDLVSGLKVQPIIQNEEENPF
jgi:predicted GIY-YIG superfamily endonuclease